MDALPVVIVVAFVILAIVAGIFSHLSEKRRRERLQAFAGRLGCRFSAKDPYDLADRYEDRFPTLRQGSNRYAYNVVHGRRGPHALFIFDHHYETHSSDSEGRQTTHHHHRTFLLIEHDTDLGTLEIRPEGFFDKIKAAFGFDDVDFESAEFSRRYYVRAKDRKLAYDLFHPEMMEYFLALKDFKLTMAGGSLLARRGSGRLEPAAIERVLRETEGFLERIPRYLRKDRSLGADAS